MVSEFLILGKKNLSLILFNIEALKVIALSILKYFFLLVKQFMRGVV